MRRAIVCFVALCSTFFVRAETAPNIERESRQRTPILYERRGSVQTRWIFGEPDLIVTDGRGF